MYLKKYLLQSLSLFLKTKFQGSWTNLELLISDLKLKKV